MKSPERVMAHYLQTSNTDSFVPSIAPFERNWHPSQRQQKALLAEIALVVNGSVADEVTVSISSSSSQADISFDLVLVLSVPTVATYSQFQF